MADPERYLTVEELQRELPFHWTDINPDLTEAEYDQLLQDTLRSESARIERWVDVEFSLTHTTEQLSRPESAPERELPLPERPIESVQSVTVETTSVTDLTEGEDYAVEETHLVLLKDAAVNEWPTEYRSISVEWTHGHDGVPADVEEALVRLCRARLKRTQSDGLESESTGDGSSVSYEPDEVMLSGVYATVDDYDAPSYYGGSSVV
jgi:hypothetical protein